MNIPEAIVEELVRATDKFPVWPTDPLHAFAILQEEVGELCQAILDVTYEPTKSGADDVRREAVQVAAMAHRFLLSLDKYEYKESDQHFQGDGVE